VKRVTAVRNAVIAADRALAARLRACVESRAVFFVGLPGTGKRLLVHQVAHLAAERDRIVHLVHWDVARPVFEATGAAARDPLRAGVTHVGCPHGDRAQVRRRPWSVTGGGSCSTSRPRSVW
jgi:hypothetical protein